MRDGAIKAQGGSWARACHIDAKETRHGMPGRKRYLIISKRHDIDKHQLLSETGISSRSGRGIEKKSKDRRNLN